MSNIYQLYFEAYQFNRTRTLATLETIEKLPQPQQALAWRPGPGRAHIGWQLMHIGVTEDLFASERLAPSKPGEFTELWPRFRGGSTPDDNVPDAKTIRQVLERSRASLLATLSEYTEARLDEIPPALAQRGLTVRTVLSLIAWHEGHHQGQAHITLNLYKASQL
jgi:uncharacterized damage-inducible protein DinB